MSRSKAIMAYGTEADRLRAAAVAKLKGKSVSEWLLSVIRDDFRTAYGDVAPEKIHVR